MTKSAALERFRFCGVNPSQLATRVTFGLCALIAAITLIAALRMFIPLFAAPDAAAVRHSINTSASRWAPTADDAELGAPEPVRIANPFDASEVFEFPAGTTPADARAAVADTLLQRARERYAQLDSRSASH